MSHGPIVLNFQSLLTNQHFTQIEGSLVVGFQAGKSNRHMTKSNNRRNKDCLYLQKCDLETHVPN